MKINDEFYMDLAIKEAWKYQFLTYKNPAVGCVIVDKNGKILSIQAHQKYGFAHAELNAIISAISKDKPINTKTALHLYQYALKNHNNIFKDATIYITLSPCTHHGKTPPCAALIKELGFKKIIYALEDESLKCKSDDFFKSIQIKKNVLKNEALKLLEPFLKDQVVIFKLATTINGKYKGKITNAQTDAYTHTIRQNVDLLVIGGNTARLDKPILDTRKAQTFTKNPDIFIHTRNPQSISTNTPLFAVKERKVSIGKDLPDLKNKIVLIEGGENFLNLHKDKTDYLMLIQNHTLTKNHPPINIDLKLQLLHQFTINTDTINIFKILK